MLAEQVLVWLQEEPMLTLSLWPAPGDPNKPAMDWETMCQLGQLLFPGDPKDLKLMSKITTPVGLAIYKKPKKFLRDYSEILIYIITLSICV